MGLFSIKLPKCPHCGGPTVRTYAAYPYPQLRCNACCDRNSEKKKMEDRITDLENKIEKLSKPSTNEQRQD